MTFPQIMASGQTGAEQAALDWAVTNEVPHDGGDWVRAPSVPWFPQ